MTPVYQRIDDPARGDCFKCCVRTLLGLDYDDVPNFVELGEKWWEITCDTFLECGYVLGERSYLNPNVPLLENPVAGCFYAGMVASDCTFGALRMSDGVDGVFLAHVYSPKYTNASEHPISHLHSVLCDVNFNIVFDPQKDYEGIVRYPYSGIIGYNGIRGIDSVRRK